MSTYPCKLVTEQGVSFVCFNDTVDQFVSFVASSPQALGVMMATRDQYEDSPSVEEWSDYASKSRHVHLMTRDAIVAGMDAVTQLMTGYRDLTSEECLAIRNLDQFLKATVAPHQSLLANNVIREIGIRIGFPFRMSPWDEIDSAQWRSHQYGVYSADEQRSLGSLPSKATHHQMRLAGMYIYDQMERVRLIGAGHQTPEQVVNYCFLRLIAE